MLDRSSLGAIALATALAATPFSAEAFDDAKYPDWKGQWIGGWTQRLPPDLRYFKHSGNRGD